MKVHSYTVLHYGASYLPYALRSVAPFVEASHVVYTPHPSHGHGTEARPIESEAELKAAAVKFDQGKVRWYSTSGLYHEGQHRDTAVQICQEAGAELVLVLDCDEVWPAATLQAALDFVWQADSTYQWLINFTHLWRSFDWCCRDDAWPVRILDLRHAPQPGHAATVQYLARELGEIYHFGYAVTDKVLHYKMSIHGHKDEFRPDWLATKWQAAPPVEDCHPTNGRKTNGDGYWTTTPFDRAALVGLMDDHPFWGLERIE